MFRRLLLIAALALAPLAALAQNTVSFTLVAELNPDGSVSPRLNWTTTPPAASCDASGDWTGPLPPQGNQVQNPTTSSKTYTIQCGWPGSSIATFTWVPATQNESGSAYVDPATLRIKYSFGAVPTAASACAAPVVCVDVPDPAAARPSMKTVTGLSNVGTLRAIAQHINSQGVSSQASNATSKVFTGNISMTQNVVLNFPGAPTGFGAN